MRIVGVRNLGDRHAVILENGQELEGVSSIGRHDRVDFSDTVEMRLIVHVRTSDLGRFSNMPRGSDYSDWRRFSEGDWSRGEEAFDEHAERGAAERSRQTRENYRNNQVASEPEPIDFDRSRLISREMMERIQSEMITPPPPTNIPYARVTGPFPIGVTGPEPIGGEGVPQEAQDAVAGYMRGVTEVRSVVDEEAHFVVGEDGRLETINEDVFIIDDVRV